MPTCYDEKIKYVRLQTNKISTMKMSLDEPNIVRQGYLSTDCQSYLTIQYLRKSPRLIFGFTFQLYLDEFQSQIILFLEKGDNHRPQVCQYWHRSRWIVLS